MIVKMQSVLGEKADKVAATSVATMEVFQILLSFCINFAELPEQNQMYLCISDVKEL